MRRRRRRKRRERRRGSRRRRRRRRRKRRRRRRRKRRSTALAHDISITSFTHYSSNQERTDNRGYDFLAAEQVLSESRVCD